MLGAKRKGKSNVSFLQSSGAFMRLAAAASTRAAAYIHLLCGDGCRLEKDLRRSLREEARERGPGALHEGANPEAGEDRRVRRREDRATRGEAPREGAR